MPRVRLLFALASTAVPVVLLAQGPQGVPPGTPLQSANLLAAQGRYRDAADVYRRALEAAGSDPAALREARTGLTVALLRSGQFTAARGTAESLTAAAPQDPAATALYGDTLWASGLFEEADTAWASALALDANDARAHHGRARALAAQSHLDEALTEAQAAAALAPTEPEFRHTVAVIYERLHRFADAANSFTEYLKLLPNRDRTEKALWTRAEIRFLDGFRGRKPLDFGGNDTGPWTVPIRIENDKVMVKVKVNGAKASEFVLDTGAEHTVLSREIARNNRVIPITYMQSAGVGDVGFRGLQVGRVETLEVGGLKVHNVPCLIKNPPLGELPAREPESFSPLALGLSMRIDYARRELVMGKVLPPATYTTELPLRMYRLATVRGMVNGRPTSFVVDTGGEVISISQATAGEVSTPGAYRKIPLKVYGTSGWDKDAFLLPNVDLQFNSIRFSKIPVVVLNLQAPSALLGFDLGGIVGHKFLSQYRVSIDLARSIVGLDHGPQPAAVTAAGR